MHVVEYLLMYKHCDHDRLLLKNWMKMLVDMIRRAQEQWWKQLRK